MFKDLGNSCYDTNLLTQLMTRLLDARGEKALTSFRPALLVDQSALQQPACLTKSRSVSAKTYL